MAQAQARQSFETQGKRPDKSSGPATWIGVTGLAGAMIIAGAIAVIASFGDKVLARWGSVNSSI